MVLWIVLWLRRRGSELRPRWEVIGISVLVIGVLSIPILGLIFDGDPTGNYWIPMSVFAIAYGLVLERPGEGRRTLRAVAVVVGVYVLLSVVGMVSGLAAPDNFEYGTQAGAEAAFAETQKPTHHGTCRRVADNTWACEGGDRRCDYSAIVKWDGYGYSYEGRGFTCKGD